MKLEFEIIRPTILDALILNDRILQQLKTINYIITERKENLIVFKDDKWEFRNKSVLYKKVDHGRFEIISSDQKAVLKYTYYISLFPQLVLCLIILFLSLVVIENYYVLLLVIPFLLQLLIRINTLKSHSEDLMSDLLKD